MFALNGATIQIGLLDVVYDAKEANKTKFWHIVYLLEGKNW